MRSARSHRPLALVLLATLGGLALVMLGAWRWGEARGLAAQDQQARQQLDLYAQALLQRIDRYRALPQVLALDPQLQASLAGPVDAPTRLAINRRLERASRTTQASTLTLIDAAGIAVAASNWRQANSNVGHDYGFRPYVTQALRSGHGRFYGIGVTTGVPGYFLSEALRDAQGRVLGVIAIKLELSALEREWAHIADTVLVSDGHGIVFLASDEDWRYRALAPLDAATAAELAATRQYEGRTLRPLRTLPRRTLHGGVLHRLLQPPAPGLWLWQRQALPETGWTLHLLHEAGAVTAAARQAALIAGASWLALVFLLLFVHQRLRLGVLRRRSRVELETLVKQHARELRTARDGVVEAAQQADTGLSRRLAHLPQGVVIIDAELKLVAWNARYVELFRFPPDLMRVGRPIEDVFRYNARRGLLGPGPVEEAIQRRLDHLRSGKPHMHEREKDDGMVLEIRGNPLPDGGFVTSYADITSYKAAARDLRSLADSLERRIAERTADLQQAREDAERANRYKTRFVAAAVHDLLQPLNAARMFLSVLRARLHPDDTRDVADSVEGALAAQDAILASLLDISRLESGTLQAQVRDFAVGPLLEALAREFGILAQSRGLRLDYVRTRAVVRSDEALLRRILQNFLSNAVRYTARGRIVLGCRRQGASLCIEVHDSGPGIAPHRQREIFEEFRRLDDGGAHERGAGLGLAIVERVARLLRHDIGLRSQPGRGSVFSVTVPLGDGAHLPPAPAAPAAGAEASLLHGVRVWCVDPDAESRHATCALLRRWGCDAAATDAADAETLAQGGDAPDLVLLDASAGDEPAVASFERWVQHWGARPPVILIAGEGHADAARARARQQGWGFLAKPVRPPALRALMTQLLLRRG